MTHLDISAASMPTPTRARPRHLNAPCAQRGQAIVETTVVLLALAALWWAVMATGAWQDEALRTGLVAREAAFAQSRWAMGATPEEAQMAALTEAFTPAPDSAQLPKAQPIDLALRTLSSLTDATQPGGAQALAATLRQDWGWLEPVRAVRAESQAPRYPRLIETSLSFARQTVVLHGAGHAVSDWDAQARVARAPHTWQQAAQASRAAGQALATRLQAVDLAWARPAPDFDWLQPWAAVVPPQVLQPPSLDTETQP